MRIGICDDEAAQRQLIPKYIQEWAKERRVRLETVLFASAENVLFCLEDDPVFDLLILDIEMGSVNGIELAGRLRKNGSDVPILFVTGYEQYMAQGYEVFGSPVDRGSGKGFGRKEGICPLPSLLSGQPPL